MEQLNGLVEYADGTKYWYLNGKVHREDGPSVEWADGTKKWYLNSKLHRKDGPAIEYADGDKEWYLNDKRHREDGPAIEQANGTKKWFYYVGTDSRGYDFYCFYDGKDYYVKVGCRQFKEKEALEHWKNNPECLELAKLAIAKFGLWS
jgi:hypothetical protein